jgi:hypothetical protein
MEKRLDKKPTLEESVRAMLSNPDLDRKLVPPELLCEYEKYHPTTRMVKAADGVLANAYTGIGNKFDLGPTLGSGNIWAGGDRYGSVIIKGNGASGPVYAQLTNEGVLTFITADGGIMMEDEVSDAWIEGSSIVVGQDFKHGRIRVFEVDKILAIQQRGGFTGSLPMDTTLQEFNRAMSRIDPATTLMP